MRDAGEYDSDIQGWYYRNLTSEPVRVRLSTADRSVSLHALSGRLVASWSLDQLETREVPVLGQSWRIGDRRLPEASLVIENDLDYGVLHGLSTGLRPVRARLWRQLSFAAIHSGNRTGWPVLVLVILVSLAIASWRLLPL